MVKNKRPRDHTGDGNSKPSRAAKKIAMSMDFTTAESTRDLARPYLLATAQLPTPVLDYNWSVGKNRQVNEIHIQNLCQAFVKGNLQREARENYLFVLCNKVDVQRMIDHPSSALPEGSGVFRFQDWISVNGTQRVELMAGQHRVYALEAYVQKTIKDTNPSKRLQQLWWTCEFYDKGMQSPALLLNYDTNPILASLERLPYDLNIQLRVNRPDLSLPDGHGQIWAQMVSAKGQDSTLFQESNGPIITQVDKFFRFSGQKFPQRRLVTLWKAKQWNDIISQWCNTSIGRPRFNISSWDAMAGCRIEDVGNPSIYRSRNRLNIHGSSGSYHSGLCSGRSLRFTRMPSGM